MMAASSRSTPASAFTTLILSGLRLRMKYPALGGGMLAPNVIRATFVIEAEAAGFRRELPAPIVTAELRSGDHIIEAAFSFCAGCLKNNIQLFNKNMWGCWQRGVPRTVERQLSCRGAAADVFSSQRCGEQREAETGAGAGTHLSVVPQTSPSVLAWPPYNNMQSYQPCCHNTHQYITASIHSAYNNEYPAGGYSGLHLVHYHHWIPETSLYNSLVSPPLIIVWMCVKGPEIAHEMTETFKKECSINIHSKSLFGLSSNTIFNFFQWKKIIQLK